MGTGAASAGDEAATLLALMGPRGGWSLDALVDASGLHVGAVQFGLMTLELDGRVSFDGLGSYAPCPPSNRVTSSWLERNRLAWNT